MYLQVQGSQAHRSPHGQVAKVWRKVTGILSSLPEFAVYGGIKPDAAKKRCAELMASFRQDNKNSEFKSGNRTGASEQVHRILWDLIQDEDADRDSKKVKAAANAEKEDKQSRRAEEVRNDILRMLLVFVLFAVPVGITIVYVGVEVGCCCRLAPPCR